jgi:Ser/Thr protein kinase RdoA (MazF antagonist)
MHSDEDVITTAARGILPKFGIGTDVQLTLLAAGHNHVFRVDYGMDRFVLRLQSGRLSDAARSIQLAWMLAIRAETSVCVPEPVAAVGGEWALPAKDVTSDVKSTWVLLRWVSGERLQKSAAFVTPSVLGDVGETIARLHEHSATYRPCDTDSAPKIDAEGLVGDKSCLADGTAKRLLADAEYTILVGAASKITAAIDQLQSMPGQAGLIHGDLSPANWVFHGSEPRIIDFDEFGHGVFLFDLLGVLATHTMWDEYPSFQRYLLSGYTRVRPLASEVIQLANVMQAATLFAWLNHGCRLADDTARSEFLKSVPSTASVISRLAGIGGSG